MANEYKGVSEFSIGKLPGLLRLGVIVDFDPTTLEVQVSLSGHTEYNTSRKNTIAAQLPVDYYSPLQKMFVGGYPINGTPVIVGQGESDQWFIVTMLAKNPAGHNTSLPFLPDLDVGTYTLQADNKFIKLSNTEGITLGDLGNRLELDPDRDVFSTNFRNNYAFTEASRTIDGIILRDTLPNNNFVSSLRATALSYNDTLKIIPLDPIATDNISNVGTAIRNPPRVEKREIVYEFGSGYNVLSDDQEFGSYQDSKNIYISHILNRRESRADTLSLSLVAPNYLMETIKGTVVDIYGNVLDINRSILPIGKDKLSIQSVKLPPQNGDPLGNVFDNIKTLERREIAFHFEINAKKKTLGPPPVEGKDAFTNYARQRSRFHLDIDKEGMLKLNVPASSETGNIPLLTRYENFSTVNPNPKTNDPNDLVMNADNQDILIESFSVKGGAVKITDALNSHAAPVNRQLTPKDAPPIYVKHGTAYHDISQTCNTFQHNDLLKTEATPTTIFGRGLIANKTTMVSPEVTLSGKNANGGGRSGSLNFDGSLDINIGANTVDRQSLWLDCQGGMIGNFGRDTRNNISAALQFDGEVLIQSGGETSNDDTRFQNNPNINNGNKAGAFDIRVITQSGDVNIIRIDDSGITIRSHGRMTFYSALDMEFRSEGTIRMTAPQGIIQDRKVMNFRGKGSM